MVPVKYRHLIFDLDRTLWDFDANSLLALEEMFVFFGLHARGVADFESFHRVYKKINAGLWDDYRKALVTRETLSLNRFLHSIRAFGLDDEKLALEMSAFYVRVFPGAHEALAYLHPRYRLHVLTNGFADVQYRKLERSGLKKYFDHIITSEEAGAHKPSPVIFEYTLEKIGAPASECLMIGDDPEVDLHGARNAGMDQMLANFDGQTDGGGFTFEITSLDQLKHLL
jgi:putative hydrolase of the HAD superfamily